MPAAPRLGTLARPIPVYAPTLTSPTTTPNCIQTLPYGVSSTPHLPGARVGVRIGDHMPDLTATVASALDPTTAGLFSDGTSRPSTAMLRDVPRTERFL